MKLHPTDRMLAELLWTLDNEQLVLFAHLVGCNTCREILAKMPPEKMEQYRSPRVPKVKTTHPIPTELLSFPLDEDGRPRPPRSPRKDATRKGRRYDVPFHPKG